MSRVKICLAMIVKNEEQDIKRCLDSVKDYIDYWVISDTGSKDKTKQLVQEIMDGHGIPGKLHEHTWKDFSTNRNYVLELAKDHGDFVWFMDADDNFVSEMDDPFKNLSPEEHHGASMRFAVNGYKFDRNCVVNPKHNWAYHGVLHEVLMIDGEPTPCPRLGGCHVVARSSPTKRAESKEAKYAKDVKILLKEYKKNRSDTRTIFYLAQSYRDSGDDKNAVKYYKERLKFPDKGFDKELEISAIEIARAMVRLKKRPEECIYAAMKAWGYNPYRIEPAIIMMEIYMTQQMFFAAFTVGQSVAKIADDQHVQIHHSEYDTRVRFPAHYAFCCYKIGLYDLAVANIEVVLKYDKLSDKERKVHESRYDGYKQAYDNALA